MDRIFGQPRLTSCALPNAGGCFQSTGATGSLCWRILLAAQGLPARGGFEHIDEGSPRSSPIHDRFLVSAAACPKRRDAALFGSTPGYGWPLALICGGMDRAKLTDALTRLGLPVAASEVYVMLLDRPPGTLDSLAVDLGADHGWVHEAYDQLVSAGLASAAGHSGDVVAPVPPAASLEILRRRRGAELDAARLAVAAAFESFRRLRLSQYTDDLVEVVTGEQIQWRIKQDMDSVQREIRRFDSPPYFFSGAVNADEELSQLGRGVTHRTVYARASLQHPQYLAENIEPCIRAGEQARVVASLPVKLTLIDDAVAHLSLSITEADVNNSLLVVRPCGLLSALTALFELSWQAALPFYGRQPTPARTPPAERRLLALLAAGVNDEDIAVQLGISRRTLFRRVELLMTKLGATTRFQLALHAQRRGLL